MVIRRAKILTAADTSIQQEVNDTLKILESLDAKIIETKMSTCTMSDYDIVEVTVMIIYEYDSIKEEPEEEV